MKKFVFAAIAALAIVSVSNVFAGNKVMNNAMAAPTDTVAPTTPDSVQTDSAAAAPSSSILALVK